MRKRERKDFDVDERLFANIINSLLTENELASTLVLFEKGKEKKKRDASRRNNQKD